MAQPGVSRSADCCSDMATGSGLGDCCRAGARTPEGIAEIDSRRISPEMADVRSAGFALLLEEGRPVPPIDVATASGVSEIEVEARVAEAVAAGRARLDDSGDLIGIAGLSVVPTRHRVDIDDRTRFTWCALDAVGILGALEADGRVTSIEPDTGDRIVIDFVGGVPAGAASMFILRGYDGSNVVDEWCSQVNFFVDAVAAEAHHRDGDIVSIADVAGEAAQMWGEVVRP